MVAAGAARLVELVDRAARAGRRRRRRRSCPARTGSPRRAGSRPPRGTRCGRAALTESCTTWREVLVGPVAAGEADQAEARRQQPAVGQVVDRRHHLLARQVAGHAEEHHAARAGDPGQPAVLRVAQRVAGLGRRLMSSALVRPAQVRRAALAGAGAAPGAPCSASTCPSPTAWAVRNSWKVNGRSGHGQVGLGLRR